MKPIFDAYTLPSNPETSFIHQHCTQEVFKSGQVWFIELNRTEHFCYKLLFLTASWELSVIYTLWFVLPGLCVPGCHRGWVVWSILIWLLVMSSTTVNILCPLFPREKEGSDFEFLCHDPEPGFLSCFLTCADVLDSLEWLKWHGMPIFNPELIFFFLWWNLNVSHSQTPHWNGEVLIHELNPTEGTKKKKKPTQTYLSVTLVSLCVLWVSREGPLEVWKWKKNWKPSSRMAEASWETSGATPSPSYNPCPAKRVQKSVCWGDGFQFLSGKRNFPSGTGTQGWRNLLTLMTWCTFGAKLRFSIFYSLIFAYGQGNAGWNFGMDGLPVCRGKGRRQGWTFPEPGSFWVPSLTTGNSAGTEGKKSQQWNIPWNILPADSNCCLRDFSAQRLYKHFQLPLMGLSVTKAPNCCSNPYRQVEHLLVMSSTVQKWAMWRITSLGSFW